MRHCVDALPRHAIAGGTGLIGKELAARLADRVILSRSQAAGTQAWRPHRPLTAELRQLALQLQSIVCLCGTPLTARRFSPSFKQQLADSRLVPLQASIELLGHSQAPQRTLIVASGTGVYPDSDRLCDESTAAGDGFLANLGQQIETLADSASAEGIRVIKLRIGVVLSTRGGALKSMLPTFRLGLGARLGSGTQWFSWIALHDLVSAILFCLEQPRLSGVINATSPQPVTNAELSTTLGRVLGRPARMRMPATILRLMLGEVADILLASNRVIPRRLLDAGFAFIFPDIESALRDALLKKN